MGRRWAYFEPSNNFGNNTLLILSFAPLPKRDSSNTTPRSLSISAFSNVRLLAQSSSTWNPFSMFSFLSVGMGRIYTVSSKLVYAFKSAPNSTPMVWRKDTSSFFLKFFVPLKAMCSVKWARPCWSSSSNMEPVFTTSLSSTFFSGLEFLRM